ncbi:hypothetical protein [Pontibacter sp. G13]|uniref:hypothetical protein n=1 Tax=Pontibacter sp. G13 TaxID=3074898 RepID=UPI00288A0BCF|nr:hypothetical protein [Pontibacter sp. G13]WNJ21284.1 hypothetical protein RJD25_12515 [Pontibacter sp. G13]
MRIPLAASVLMAVIVGSVKLFDTEAVSPIQIQFQPEMEMAAPGTLVKCQFQISGSKLADEFDLFAEIDSLSGATFVGSSLEVVSGNLDYAIVGHYGQKGQFSLESILADQANLTFSVLMAMPNQVSLGNDQVSIKVRHRVDGKWVDESKVSQIKLDIAPPSLSTRHIGGSLVDEGVAWFEVGLENPNQGIAYAEETGTWNLDIHTPIAGASFHADRLEILGNYHDLDWTVDAGKIQVQNLALLPGQRIWVRCAVSIPPDGELEGYPIQVQASLDGSEFALQSVVKPISSFPLLNESLFLSIDGDQGRIQWMVPRQWLEPSSNFLIDQADNGGAFSQIGLISGEELQGSGFVEFPLPELDGGSHYFRVRSLVNGVEYISQVLEWMPKPPHSYRVIQWPAIWEQETTLKWVVKEAQEVEVWLYTAQGHPVKRLAQQLSKPHLPTEANLRFPDLAQGAYQLVLKGEDFQEFHPLTIPAGNIVQSP